MRLLYRHFLRSFFQSDLLAEGGDPRALAISAAALFAAPGMALCVYMVPVAGRVDTTPELACFIGLAMILMGLLAVLEWDALFPDRNDFMILRPMPLAAGTILGAKVASLAVLVAGFDAIVNCFSATMLPMMSLPGSAGWGQLFRQIGAQVTATGAASAWLFLFIVGAQGLALCLGGEAGVRRLGPALQLTLMVLMVAALLFLPNVTSPAVFTSLVRTRPWPAAPVLWFVGLDKLLAGGASPAWRALAFQGLEALAVVAGAAVIFYALGYWRRLRQSLSVSRPRAASALRRLLRDVFDRWCLPWPRQRAVFHFALATLIRCRRQRLYLAAWLGLGMGLVLEGGMALTWHRGAVNAAALRVAALAAPLLLGFFLLVGLRHIFAIPAELPAHWVFQMSETGPQPERFGAGLKLMLAGAAPILPLALPVPVWLWGWRAGALSAAFAVCLALLLCELLLCRFRKLPFTCAYLPGETNAAALWVLYWFGLTACAYSMAALELHLRLYAWRWIAVLCGLALAAAALEWDRRRWLGQQSGSEFDPEPVGFVQTLFGRDGFVA